MPDIELETISYKDKQILRNLMQLCQHDSSEYDGNDLNEHGLYEYRYLDHYWTEPARHPFLIRVSGQIAGFVLVRDIIEESPANPPHSIAEFFIVRKYRREGVGTAVAHRIFNSYPGRWIVGQRLTNTTAQSFWRRAIAEYSHGDFKEGRNDTHNLIEFCAKCEQQASI